MRFDRSVGSVPKWFTALRKPSIWFFRYLLLKGSCNYFLSQGGNQERGKKKKKEELKICSFQFTLKQNTHIQESKLILLSEMRMKICTEICIWNLDYLSSLQEPSLNSALDLMHFCSPLLFWDQSLIALLTKHPTYFSVSSSYHNSTDKYKGAFKFEGLPR